MEKNIIFILIETSKSFSNFNNTNDASNVMLEYKCNLFNLSLLQCMILEKNFKGKM